MSSRDGSHPPPKHCRKTSLIEIGEWPGCKGVDGIHIHRINDMLKMKSAANVQLQIWRMNAGKIDLQKDERLYTTS
jgi:hypothetical protein